MWSAGKFQASMKWRRKAATNDEAQLQRVREDFRYWQPRERDRRDERFDRSTGSESRGDRWGIKAEKQGLENELKAKRQADMRNKMLSKRLIIDYFIYFVNPFSVSSLLLIR